MSTSDQSAASAVKSDRAASSAESDRVTPQRAKPDRAKSEQVTSSTPVRFMTVAEVAATMRVSKMTVYRLVRPPTAGKRALP